jgi:hypothetical protein
LNNFNIIDLIKCKIHHYTELPICYHNSRSYFTDNNNHKYFIIPTDPATGILYISEISPYFISGHLRLRGKHHGKYPFSYLEMIDNIFGKEENIIEVCSGSIRGNCFTVDINPETKPDLVADRQKLYGIPNSKFSRWRCDPPYNTRTAKEMYGTDLPRSIELLKAGARVCKIGSLLFLLLGPKNYQWHLNGVKRVGCVPITIVPNNEIRCLNIFYKYQNY